MFMSKHTCQYVNAQCFEGLVSRQLSEERGGFKEVMLSRALKDD